MGKFNGTKRRHDYEAFEKFDKLGKQYAIEFMKQQGCDILRVSEDEDKFKVDLIVQGHPNLMDVLGMGKIGCICCEPEIKESEWDAANAIYSWSGVRFPYSDLHIPFRKAQHISKETRNRFPNARTLEDALDLGVEFRDEPYPTCFLICRADGGMIFSVAESLVWQCRYGPQVCKGEVDIMFSIPFTAGVVCWEKQDSVYVATRVY